jgi:hypothetical protein
MKRLLIAVLLTSLTLGIVLGLPLGARASADRLNQGAVISAINHTADTAAALQGATTFAASSLKLVDVTALFHPPSPCAPSAASCDSPALDHALYRNGDSILALRQELAGMTVTTGICSTDGGGCLVETTTEYLSGQGMDLTSVATVAPSDATYIIYFHPPNPCMQNPTSASACGIGD